MKLFRSMLMKRTSALLALCLMFAGPVLAEEPALYKVELIIFENNDPAALTSENWPQNPGMPAMDKAVEFGAAADAPTGTGPQAPELLPDSELQLNNIEGALIRSHQHEPLVHIAWLQPLETNDTGVTLHVHSDLGRNAVPSRHAVDGIVNLVRGRYLHVNADLVYNYSLRAARRSPETAASDQETAAQIYRMKVSRRMRSGEVHYLDHPMFGMVILMTDVKKAASAKKPEPKAETIKK